jgi:hydrogenase maturation factor HypF (carbamoyltransferase family)
MALALILASLFRLNFVLSEECTTEVRKDISIVIYYAERRRCKECSPVLQFLTVAEQNVILSIHHL